VTLGETISREEEQEEQEEQEEVAGALMRDVKFSSLL
jgi:hypothetical protein